MNYKGYIETPYKIGNLMLPIIIAIVIILVCAGIAKYTTEESVDNFLVKRANERDELAKKSRNN